MAHGWYNLTVTSQQDVFVDTFICLFFPHNSAPQKMAVHLNSSQMPAMVTKNLPTSSYFLNMTFYSLSQTVQKQISIQA